jgi:phosphate transport system protein
MARHLQNELEKVKKRILTLGAMVEKSVRMAIQAIRTRDSAIAEAIIASDYEIDEMEVEVEEDCLKILALHQPVAVDLRFITAVIKINNDLERIADEAVNIAQGVENISKTTRIDIGFNYQLMAEKVESMLKFSLDALVHLDTDIGFKVCTMDDEVDTINREVHTKVKQALREHPDYVEYLISMMLISRHLERIADHATNIAEEVIYLIEGEIIRHGNY